MKLKHIAEIKGKVSLTSKVKSTNILDGAYRSIFKGKSLNFEELREYNIGDNIKDIDWRASARSMNILVRQHIAEKKHNVLFILDSKFDMNANANPKDVKRDICINVTGTLAYLANRNGDYTAAIYMSKDNPKFFQLEQSLFHIENYLTFYEEDLKNQRIKKRRKEKNSINDSIKYIVNYMSKKSIIFIICDLLSFEEMDEELIKSLSYHNDIMMIIIKDISLYNSKSFDVDNRRYFAPMISKSRHLAKIDQEEKEKVYEELSEKYKKYCITTISIESEQEVIPKIIELLKEHNDLINK